MSSIPVPLPLVSAAAVFCGPHGAVTRLAQARGVFRQTLYREAHAVADALDPLREDALASRQRQQTAALQADIDSLRQQLRHAVIIDADKQAEFAATGQAQGVSLWAIRALLAVLLGQATPSVAKLGRRTQQAGRRATAALEALDPLPRRRARQIAADEIFSGRRPVLMTIEQDSLCWLGGRLADKRDGDEWAKEFARLPAAEQVTRDGGQGMERGLKVVNAQRRTDHKPPIADQEDHFHILHRGRRGLRAVKNKARKALRKAEKTQAEEDQVRRRGRYRPGLGSLVALRWRQATAAFDRWSAHEQAFERLRAGLRLFTPSGELNTRQRAEAEVRAALAELTGPEWSRLRTRLVGPKAFTYLERVQEQLAALPVSEELREAAVQVEGLRRQPEGLRGSSPAAGALRGVLLASGLVLTLAGQAGAQALALVRGVLDGARRSSSLIEGLNSVLRMQQRRQKRLTQGLLDLKRLYWNMHVFVAGRRKKTSPYGRLGIKLPEGGWWQLLKMTPEQLRDQLSELNPPA
jgi:hypothetical protein